MNDKEKKKLVEMAKNVELALSSQKRFLFPEDYISGVVEKTNKLIGFILAFEKE